MPRNQRRERDRRRRRTLLQQKHITAQYKLGHQNWRKQRLKQALAISL